ncbi:MAG: glycosyltransferase family 4 protein [Bacteroidales bacterium]|nr:glycosyltransferase family 4 protein [Bacteroidales bacterium]MDT8374973.1 glycosyltransferase family 4 protein [Bacteroidales bacterium]
MGGVPTVHLVHFYSSPGGIEVLSSRLLTSFTGYLFRVFVVRPVTEGRINVYEGAVVPVSYGSCNNLRAMFRLWRYARRYRSEIFHLFNLGPFFLMTVRLAGAKRIIYSIHGTRYWKNSWQRAVRKPLWRWAIGKNVKITSNSEYSRRVFLEKVYHGAEIQVVYNPMSSGRFVPYQNSSRGIVTPPVSKETGMNEERGMMKEAGPMTERGRMKEPGVMKDTGMVKEPGVMKMPQMAKEPGIMKIVYAGRLDRGKNLEKWIDVAVDLHRGLKMTLFEIYGTGPMYESLAARIRSKGAEDYIAIKGYRSDIENVYREADLLLFLSEYESFGNVVVESILCGTPVIASDIPSMREIFRDYPLFLVSPEGDLSGQVAALMQDYDSLANAAISAGVNFRERFSEKGYIDTLDKIYLSFNG